MKGDAQLKLTDQVSFPSARVAECAGQCRDSQIFRLLVQRNDAMHRITTSPRRISYASQTVTALCLRWMHPTRECCWGSREQESGSKRRIWLFSSPRRYWDAITQEELPAELTRAARQEELSVMQDWHICATPGQVVTSTRATSRSLWFVVCKSRKNSRTPNQMISSRPRRHWKRFGCCCVTRLLDGRQALEVAKSWW